MKPARLVLGAAVLAALLGVGLYLAPVQSALRDLRADVLAWAGMAGLAAAACWNVSAADLAPVRGRGIAALAALSILVSSAPLAQGVVDFARQVRAQWGETPAQKQADALLEFVGLNAQDLARARREIPKGGSVVLLWSPSVDVYPMSLVAYYLAPRKVYFWHGTPFQVLDGRVVARPPDSWLRARHITSMALLEDRRGHDGLTVRRLER